MASYTHFSFSQNQLFEQMDILANEALDETINEMKGWGGYLQDITKTKYSDGSVKGYLIEIEDLRAWIYYYGTGTHMWDNENPKLKEYMESGFYNKRRPSSGAIARWGYDKNGHVVPNWETGHGTMVYQGTDPAGEVLGNGVAPKEDLNKILEKAAEVFAKKVKEKFSKINISSCIITSSISI